MAETRQSLTPNPIHYGDFGGGVETQIYDLLQIYARWISACNSERMVKIGAELPKLSQT